MLPQFFHLNNNWGIVPEFVLPDNYKPYYLVSLIITTAGLDYGSCINRLVLKTKKRAGVSW